MTLSSVISAPKLLYSDSVFRSYRRRWSDTFLRFFPETHSPLKYCLASWPGMRGRGRGDTWRQKCYLKVWSELIWRHLIWLMKNYGGTLLAVRKTLFNRSYRSNRYNRVLNRTCKKWPSQNDGSRGASPLQAWPPLFPVFVSQTGRKHTLQVQGKCPDDIRLESWLPHSHDTGAATAHKPIAR